MNIAHLVATRSRHHSVKTNVTGKIDGNNDFVFPLCETKNVEVVLRMMYYNITSMTMTKQWCRFTVDASTTGERDKKRYYIEE
jgi:hypothetical protein